MSAYGYDASKPHRLASATIGGKTHAFSHDDDGNIKKYDCTSATCGDDKYIDWNGRNLPERITVGGSRTDETPTARDEFAYGPDGARYHRKTSYMDGETLRAENTYYVGSFEELLPRQGAAHASIRQTRVTDSVRHVKTTTVMTAEDGTKTTATRKYVDYLHKDHLGSVSGVTGADGARTRELAHDPFGSRRKADWTAALTESERLALAGSSDPRTRGHTGHEHLDRTGLIHRGGRVYDPTLGRFLSPDPLVGNPGSAQSWNGYSYVSNSPMSYVDPSGLSQRPVGCGVGGLLCRGQGASGGGFGLASVVSTHRFQWVDIFFSARIVIGGVYGGGNGPGVLDGWWDFMDPFVEVYHQYVHRQGFRQVTSRVPVSGVLNITGKPIGLPGVDFGFDRRVDPQTGWGKILGEIIKKLTSKKTPQVKPKKKKEELGRPNQQPVLSEDSIESVEDVFSNPSLLEGRSLEQVMSEIGDAQGWIHDVMHDSNTHPEGGWVLRELNRRGDNYTGRMIQYHPGTPRHFEGRPYWKISGIPNQRPVRVLAAP